MRSTSTVSERGVNRERDIRHLLENEGWICFRSAGSKGVCDIVALRAGDRPRLIEVKSTAQGPYERFGPSERARLSDAALLAGADALLAYWPPRGTLRWIPEKEWP